MEGRVAISADGNLDACPVNRSIGRNLDRQTFNVSVRNKKPIIFTGEALGWLGSSDSCGAVEKILATVEECDIDMLIPLDGRNFLKHSLCSVRSVNLKDGMRDILTREVEIGVETSPTTLTPQERRYIRVYFDSHVKLLNEIDLSYLGMTISDNIRKDKFSISIGMDAEQLSGPQDDSLLSGDDISPFKLKNILLSGDDISPFKLKNIGLWTSSEGCVTPLHFDLCHGFLAQIVGRKTFLLASSSEFALLRYWENKKSDGSQNGTTSSIDLGLWLDGDKTERAKYPLVDEVAWFIASLSPGDILYTPPGWWHYVISETASVSVLIPFDPEPTLEVLPTNVLTA